ncbi:MAG: hypothetical protein K2L37_06605 [Lactobacillus sp.]|nr:hypothetical protein [Lactobacillus sp.]
MILIEALKNLAVGIWKNILIPLVRFPYWLITARDCKRCKHSYWFNRYILNCSNGGKACYRTECYKTITRKDFERDK